MAIPISYNIRNLFVRKLATAITVIGIALVGYGCWGPRLARAFAIEPRARLVAVCDIRPARLAAAAADHPGVHLCERLDALWRLPGVDAIVVATPASTHAAR